MIDSISRTSIERIAFGPFCLTPGERLLTKDGAPVEIGGRSLDLLIALVAQPGRVLHKNELLKRVWPDVVVEDSSLRFHMAGLRKILGDGEDGARYIATQVGVGYAFVAPVQALAAIDGEFVAAPALPSQHEPQSILDAKLPARPPGVIGRDRDIRLLSERLSDTRLFTIVGPGGVGKTTLALETAHASLARFADKAAFVDLATLEDPALIPSAVAGALGIPVQGADPLSVVLAHIRPRQLLLILDNCEHMVDAVSRIVEQIRDAAPRVNVLATSREVLRVRGEHVHWLNPLDYPHETANLSLDELLAYPAVELFIERASAGNSALGVDAEAARLIADMCRQLDGMALPIELTAVRVAAHGLRATSALLAQRFNLAWSGQRTAVPRQQTLQATLDWSYELLSEPERLTLERLSVFVGFFSLDSALHVVTDDRIDADAAAIALDGLTTKSLLSPNRSSGTSCYRLLEMTRAYAKKRFALRGADECNATARRHAARFLHELETRQHAPLDFQTETAHFTQMLGNIRGALEWSFRPHGDPDLGVRLAALSARVFMTLSLLVECRTWCARALRDLGRQHAGTSTELELQAALGLSLMFTGGNSEAAESALRRALDIATRLDDRWNQLRLLGRLHIFHERIGDFATAKTWADTAVKVAAVIDQPEAIAIAASLAGISHHLAGDQTRARSELELSLRESLPSERARTIHYGFDHRNRSGIALARTLWLQGHADFARHVAEHIVQQAARLEHPITHCIALIWTLSVHLWRGDLDHAQASLDVFADRAELNAFQPYIAASTGFRGQLSIEREQPEGALCLLEESLARLHASRYELLTSTFETALVQGLALRGRNDEALLVANTAIDRCLGNGEGYLLPEMLRLKASVVGDPSAAERLLQESLTCARTQGARAWELRAAMDLARLWIADGRLAEAMSLLGPVRDALTEGLATRDVRAADALLRLHA
ncbi:MAG TPA: winged helix-turn-helix domain-containing protein [Povalibacter sp.]|uniref:ATP-binding protein n=1 Tax=Povalibacter sp. TaxID=1962978 RepID=UPI002C74690E|nr:winged helix-turn-helix domain-containing protein [Povalibacter sp.]HMN47257.1 winged helix-turn-helix domain-containing protein [Povalibacter sp.]